MFVKKNLSYAAASSVSCSFHICLLLACSSLQSDSQFHSKGCKIADHQ